jgi:hypothetical protein
MTYSKPEVAVLGDAVVLVQGKRTAGIELDAPTNLQHVADCEFDD